MRMGVDVSEEDERRGTCSCVGEEEERGGTVAGSETVGGLGAVGEAVQHDSHTRWTRSGGSREMLRDVTWWPRNESSKYGSIWLALLLDVQV
jgi:hypothetical protein